MNCPRCSHKMTMLFYSSVCDHCNPPGTSMKQTGSAKLYRGWIGLRISAYDAARNRQRISVFESPAKLDEFCADRGFTRYDRYAVEVREKPVYSSAIVDGHVYVLVDRDYAEERYDNYVVVRPI